jgi:hypothetical protein
MNRIVDLWTIQITRDHLEWANDESASTFMPEIEENLSDLLPAGYRARIRRWDHPDPDEGASDE